MSLSKKALFIPLLLVSYEIALYLSNDMYLPALPQMMSELNITLAQTQLTLTYWFVGSASMPLVVGVLADRFGRRPVLLIGAFIYLIATLLCVFATGLHMLLIGRLFQGAMVPTMLVSGYAIIHETYKHKEAIKILATLGSISVLAPALGPVIGSILLLLLNWRWIFIFIFVWSLICFKFLWQYLPETLTADKRESLSVKRLAGQYWRVITNLNFMLYMFGLGFIFAGFLTWITAGPLLTMLGFHFSAFGFGMIQAVVFAAYIYGNKRVKILLEKTDVSKIINQGLILTLISGVIMLICAHYLDHSFYPFLGGVVLYSYASALCFAPLNRTAIETSDEPMGIRVAIFTVFITAFAALGSAMASFFFDGTIKSLAYIMVISILLSCIMIVAARYACWLGVKSSD